MEAIGQLTGGIAHDFNNMLQGISGAVDLSARLLRAGRHAEVPKYLEMAMASVQRAASMTQRLLAFSRRHPLAAQVVDVNALLLSLQELLHRTVGENIRLQFDLYPDACHVVCDPHQLESAVLNLAINARDAMPQGGTLAVETRIATVPAHPIDGEALAPGDYVRISVRDTGTGMDEATLRQAFEPFFTTKATGQGTGLGLPMVYGFARQSQGLAQLESRPGEGTSVHLLLPRTGRSLQLPAAAASPQDDAQAAGSILLVEDDETVRSLLQRSLGDVGYRVAEAATGAQALALLARLPGIDLLVTDVGLPGGMNGRQLAEQALQQAPRLRVLLLTGYMEDTSVEAHLPMLMKPVRLDVLLRRVEDLLAAGRAGG
jgi:CheY-like chemotaxis protein